ncbi:hypothetical protein PF005_g3125 [Phytophthora fragariae]|uniref:Uncharacterized protein n=1 Tax=Phytophthora fragariae TaxID=53985 RepID=A0A6A4E615_9STRA|nr:hypothetical protein PF003_g39147 [Phytophthora fragariae]KAE8938917.1 hypothetical protein PF009_g11227 [Phytophthora fragariae]KAE9017432.1 hypothetical protein PF011_g6694 [Phytophthora fragariae]KAE9120348.1 hypothetical protein PF007_g8192 [Phytophthora fragariae]KAE9120688.1 hypothetical protein PF010_g7394 [Phytophthora fragariae]
MAAVAQHVAAEAIALLALPSTSVPSDSAPVPPSDSAPPAPSSGSVSPALWYYGRCVIYLEKFEARYSKSPHSTS